MECENVVAVKEASGRLDQAEAILDRAPKGFELLSGDDGLTLELIRRGATGVISVVANAYPAEFGTMVHAALDGDFDKAEAANEVLAPLYPTCREKRATICACPLCRPARRPMRR